MAVLSLLPLASFRDWVHSVCLLMCASNRYFDGDNEMLKKYKLGFDAWGLLLFLIVMLPNFIWFALPAPNDVLRRNSSTEMIDMIASFCQVLMITALCLLKNKNCLKMRMTPFITLTIGCCFAYFVCWVLYYCGIVNTLVILGLTVPPCLAFLFFAMDRKNRIAMIPISFFTACHLIYGVVNFML